MEKKYLNERRLTNLTFRRGLTMTDLQRQAHVSPATIRRSLKLKCPVRQTTAKKIADVLGVDVLTLLQDEPSRAETDEKGA